MQVPYEKISEEALRGIALEFVSREGTDYGEDFDMDAKVDQVISAIKKGKVLIYYNHTTQTCNLLTKRQAIDHDAALEEARLESEFEDH